MKRAPEEAARRKMHGLILLLFVLGVILQTVWVVYFD